MDGFLQGGPERSRSRMIGIDLQIRIEEWLTAGLGTAAIRFHGHENGVDDPQRLAQIEFQDPPLLRSAIFVENTQIQGPPQG